MFLRLWLCSRHCGLLVMTICLPLRAFVNGCIVFVVLGVHFFWHGMVFVLGFLFGTVVCRVACVTRLCNVFLKRIVLVKFFFSQRIFASHRFALYAF